MNKTTKRWLYFGAAAIVIFIIANAINILLVNREPEVPLTTFVQTNADNTQSTFSEISYSGSAPNFPEQLPIATTEKYTTSATDISQLIISEFNLAAHPVVPNLWTSDEWALSNATSDLFTLTKNSYSESSSVGMTVESAINTAQNFTNNYFQQLNLDIIESHIVFYGSVVHPDETDAENAQIARVPLSYTIAGYPVFYEQKSLFPFEVWVTAENTIQKFTYYPQFIQVREIGSKPLISIDQAIENINERDMGSVVRHQNTSVTVVSLEEVTQADLPSVELEYRVDPTTNQAYPFYRFAGTALLSGIETPIEITTPAVELSE